MNKMKKGEIYMVYEDPITKEKEEGFAKIVKIVQENDTGYNLCMVKFTGESTSYMRKIGHEDIK